MASGETPSTLPVTLGCWAKAEEPVARARAPVASEVKARREKRGREKEGCMACEKGRRRAGSTRLQRYEVLASAVNENGVAPALRRLFPICHPKMLAARRGGT